MRVLHSERVAGSGWSRQ